MYISFPYLREAANQHTIVHKKRIRQSVEEIVGYTDPVSSQRELILKSILLHFVSLNVPPIVL